MPEYNNAVPTRLTKESVAQLDDLKRLWGCNRSQAIERMIERTWTQEVLSGRLSQANDAQAQQEAA